jgi:hypothetical protein
MIQSAMETSSTQETTIRHLGVPLTKHEVSAINELKNRGLQKGHWVAQAIREKLQREGLLDPKSEKN